MRLLSRKAWLAALLGPLGGGAGLGAFGGCGSDPTPIAIIDTPQGDSGTSSSGSADDAGSDTAAPDSAPPPPRGKRASRGGTVAISDDDALVAMVNADDGSVSTFRAADNTLIARIPTGAEPSQVVFHPSGRTLFVANRGAATVVRIDNADTAMPIVSAPLAVGSEPTGLALTPSGNRLYVAELGESRVSIVDTRTMMLSSSIALANNPRAVLVTNNLDASDDDEILVVGEFYGEPTVDGETFDTGRTGRVRLYSVATNASRGVISLRPFVEGSADAGGPSTSAANQLAALSISGGRVYVPTTSASPSLPLRHDQNVRPVVYVGDLTSLAEVRDPDGTANLATLARQQVPDVNVRMSLGDIVDMDFVPGTRVAYVVSRAADVIQRVEYAAGGVTLGTSAVKHLDLTGAAAGCTPTGIALSANGTRGYVACLSSQKLAVLDLATQSVTTAVQSSPAPMGPDASRVRGRRFFYTGRGRWSQGATATRGGEGWSSCGSCHPDGLSDNITWVFPAGPRQSTSLDGSFSKGSAPQKQRVFNWTANVDEIHDFESNTRAVSGGRGAIYSAAMMSDCADPTRETQAALAATALGAPTAKERQGQNLCGNTDWDDIEAYVRTIRPPRGRRFSDAASVTRGAALFANGGCAKCHGGAGWTVSTRAFTPSTMVNNALAARAFSRPAQWPAAYTDHSTVQLANQSPVSENGIAIGPLQVACAIRKVGTFGYPGDVSRTDVLEKKSDNTRAQGAGGYNVPSLYGLGLGAPYLHHGGARSLNELLADARFAPHRVAGNAAFTISAEERADLIAYLLTIDADSTLVAVPTGFADGCATN